MLTLQFIPYHEIEDISSQQRVDKLLEVVKNDKIIVLEGRLRSEEEAELIKRTMESIDQKFTGIELSVVYPEQKNSSLHKRLKQLLVSMILGDRRGLTIIGPANIVKEIKQDPDKIQLFTKDVKKKR